MKKLIALSLFVLILILSSCGVSMSAVGNGSSTTTLVELSRKNFKVLEKVSGKSSNTYVFGLGGLSNKSLIEKAKNQMMDSADLTGGAKAVINITYDTHASMIFPFFMQTTITASGYVVEFIE